MPDARFQNSIGRFLESNQPVPIRPKNLHDSGFEGWSQFMVSVTQQTLLARDRLVLASSM